MTSTLSEDEMKANLKSSGLYKLSVRTVAYASSLSNTELRIVLFIYLRTLAYNKTWAVILENEFLKGAYRHGGELVAWPIGCGVEALRHTLERLENKGVIHRLREDRKISYSLNVDWRCTEMKDFFFLENHDYEDPVI